MKNKKTGVAFGIALLLIIVVAGAVVFYHNREKGGMAEQNNSKVEIPVQGAMRDGELIDYEKKGNLVLKGYKGLKGVVTPTKEEIYRSILNDVEEKKITIDGEDRIKKGDWVLMDYSGSIGGQKSEDLDEEGIVIQVGAGDLFNADFERKMTGLSLGQEYSFDVTFPNDYFDVDVAGQKVTFTVTVSCKFNENFVKALSNNKCRSLDEYLAQVKTKVRQENVDALGDTLWDDYVAKCKVKEYPEGSKKQAFSDLKRQYQGIGDMNGTSYEEVIADLGMTEEDVKGLARDEVKGRMIAKTIAAKEHITISDHEYRNYLLDEVDPEDKDDVTIMELEKTYKETTSVYPKDDMMVRLVKEFIGKYAKQE